MATFGLARPLAGLPTAALAAAKASLRELHPDVMACFDPIPAAPRSTIWARSSARRRHEATRPAPTSTPTPPARPRRPRRPPAPEQRLLASDP